MTSYDRSDSHSSISDPIDSQIYNFYRDKLIQEFKNYHSLYSNNICTVEEFNKKKENWIERLKELDNIDETEFLILLLQIIKDKKLSHEEVDKIKYIVSGNFKR